MKRGFCYLIDDDQDDREIFEIALTSVLPHIKYQSADNCVDGLKKLKEMPVKPDIAFIDINMPSMDGLCCLKEIKKDPALKKIKVFMYSTSDNPKHVRDAKVHGASDYIVKHHNFEVLRNTLKQIIRD